MTDWVETLAYYGQGQGDEFRTDGVRYQYKVTVGWSTTQDPKSDSQFVSGTLEEVSSWQGRKGLSDIAALFVIAEDIKFRCSSPYHVARDPEGELVPPTIWLEGWVDCTKEEYDTYTSK